MRINSFLWTWKIKVNCVLSSSGANTSKLILARRVDTSRLQRARQLKLKAAMKASVLNGAEADPNNCLATSAPFPLELFDEIFSYFKPPSTDYLCPSYLEWTPNFSSSEHNTFTLRSVSQTCRTFRALVLPRLWSTIGTVLVRRAEEQHYRGSVLVSLRLQVKAVAKACYGLRSRVRYVNCFGKLVITELSLDTLVVRW